MRDPRQHLISRPSENRSGEPLLPSGSSPPLGSMPTNGHGSSRLESGGRGRKGHFDKSKAGKGLSGRESRNRQKRRHEMRSRSPSGQNKYAAKQKILLAGLALGISLVAFVVQTETAVYIQHDLGWKKAYAMLYLTHGSWSTLWPLTILFLRIRKRHIPLKSFLRSHMSLVRSTAQMVQYKTNRLSLSQACVNPFPYMVKQIMMVACALTVAGSSWYVAVNMTTPSDLTAIYNCSAFFAYAFSIPLLHEKVRSGKVLSVALAIVGVMVVAYGDGKDEAGKDDKGAEVIASQRLLGNIIIGIGSVLYGFYEVLYKKVACPPENVSPGRSAIFANVVASGIGSFTLLVLWIPIPILHYTGYELFEFPRGEAAWMLVISVTANVTFSGAFLILISLTSPVLSSVAALLTIFLVAITDYFLTGVPLTFAAIIGGLIIIVAFGMLSWDSWREIQEGTEKSEVDGDDDSGSGVLSDDVIDDDIEGGKMHESSDVGSGSEDELSGGERIRAEAERRLL